MCNNLVGLSIFSVPKVAKTVFAPPKRIPIPSAAEEPVAAPTLTSKSTQTYRNKKKATVRSKSIQCDM